jgi:hypothetical protein
LTETVDVMPQCDRSGAIALTSVLTLLAVVLVGLGAEVAYSNAQTSGYSARSVFWILVYLVGVYVVPRVLTRPWGKQSLDRLILIRRASLFSLLIQILFLPTLLVIAVM